MQKLDILLDTCYHHSQSKIVYSACQHQAGCPHAQNQARFTTSNWRAEPIQRTKATTPQYLKISARLGYPQTSQCGYEEFESRWKRTSMLSMFCIKRFSWTLAVSPTKLSYHKSLDSSCSLCPWQKHSWKVKWPLALTNCIQQSFSHYFLHITKVKQ